MEDDIHICGRCRKEFRDIGQFLNHKKQCEKTKACQWEINAIQIPQCQRSTSLSKQSKQMLPDMPCEDDIFLVSNSSISKQDIENTQAINLPNMTVKSDFNQNKQDNLSVSTPSDSLTLNQHLSQMSTFSYSTKEFKALNCIVNVDGWSHYKEPVPESLIKSENLYPVQIDRFGNEKALIDKDYNNLKNVASNFILTNQQPDDLTSKIAETEIEVHFVGKGRTAQNIGIPSLTTAKNNNDIVSGSLQNVQMQHIVKAGAQQDIESYYGSSTPCPEDLEVREISAAIVGQENQHSCLKSLLGMNERLEKKVEVTVQHSSNVSNSSPNTDAGLQIEEFSSCPSYIRKNTASAPITKNKAECAVKSVRKKSLEKRERLQGVSDDLLISPVLPVSGGSNIKHMAVTRTMSSSTEKGHSNDEGMSIHTHTGYKAVFMSPSIAGHRLGFKQPNTVPTTDNLSSITAISSISKETSLTSQSLMQFKDISSTVKIIDQVPSSKPSSFLKKVERRLTFENESDQSLLSKDNSQNNTCVSVPTDQNCLNAATLETIKFSEKSSKTSPPYIFNTTSTSIAIPSINRDDIITNTLSPILQRPEQSKLFETLSAKNTQLTQYSSSPIDPATVIMVYKGGNVLMIPQEKEYPKVCSSSSSLKKTLFVQPQCGPEQLTNTVQADSFIQVQPYSKGMVERELKVWSQESKKQPKEADIIIKEKCIMKPRLRKSLANKQQKLKNQSQPEYSYSKTSASQAMVKDSLSETIKGVSTSEPNTTNSGPDTKVAYKFYCEFPKCSYATNLQKDILRHKLTHTGEKPYACQECGKRFNRTDKLKIHLRSHSGLKPFQCTLCDYASVESGSLKKHMRVHNDERPYKCQICPYASRNSSQLIVHLRTHTGDSPFHCTICPAQFKINSDLKRHMRIHTGEKPFKCDKCDYKSTNKGNLKTHQKINHSKDNEKICPKCNFTTSSKKRFRDHLKTHDTKGILRCTRCDYTCSSLPTLKNHLKNHNPTRPFQCHYCSYSSKQSKNLKKHIQSLHVDKVKPGSSGKKFKSSRPESTLKLRKHKNSNLNQVKKSSQPRRFSNYRKLHQCLTCGSSFVREDSLRCHMRHHSVKIDEPISVSSVSHNVTYREKKWTTAQTPAINTSESRVLKSKVHQGMHHIAAAASKAFQEQFIQNTEECSHQQDPIYEVKVNKTSSISQPISENEMFMATERKDSSLTASTRGNKSLTLTANTAENESLSSESNIVKDKDELPWEHRSYTLSCSNSITASTISAQSSDSKPEITTTLFENKTALQQKLGFPSQIPTIDPSHNEENSSTSVFGGLINEYTNQNGNSDNKMTYKLHLVPQIQSGTTLGNDVLNVTQDMTGQIGVNPAQLTPSTHIQIVLPGATVPNIGVNQQQILLQVQDSTGQSQELISIPVDQSNSSLHITSQDIPVLHQPQSNIAPVAVNDRLIQTNSVPISGSFISQNSHLIHSNQLTPNHSFTDNNLIGNSNVISLAPYQDILLQAHSHQLLRNNISASSTNSSSQINGQIVSSLVNQDYLDIKSLNSNSQTINDISHTFETCNSGNLQIDMETQAPNKSV